MSSSQFVPESRRTDQGPASTPKDYRPTMADINSPAQNASPKEHVMILRENTLLEDNNAHYRRHSQFGAFQEDDLPTVIDSQYTGFARNNVGNL